MGTGTIARQFTDQLVRLPDARLVGVASRDRAKAESFVAGCRHAPPPLAHDSYAALCAAPGIDAIYIATPTASHATLARMALEAGKPVLCEKPFCRNAQEAAEIFALARERGLFVMEAMWMRFNPLIQKTRTLIAEGAIGPVRSMQVDLGYAKPPQASGQAAQGRGARLAFGCYGVSLALYLFGAPRDSALHLVHGPQQIEDTMALTLEYPGHVVSIHASEGATLSNTARLQGQRGQITIAAPFIDTTALEVVSLDALARRSPLQRVASRLGLRANPFHDDSLRGAGFRGEAAEVMRCLRAGLIESPVMPQSDTLLAHRLLQTG